MFRYKAEALKLSNNMGKTYAQAVAEAVKLQYFPIDIWIIIWKKMFSSFVLQELKQHESVWAPKKKQSRKLKMICSEDVGAIQFGFTDFDRLVDKYHRTEVWSWRTESIIKVERCTNDKCLIGDCLHCKLDGFPCTNLMYKGLSINVNSYETLWKID